MKLAVAACCAICLCLGSLAARSLFFAMPKPRPPQPAARSAPHGVDKRALATVDKKLGVRLRRLAQAAELPQ